MHTLYVDINHPICCINRKLEMFPLKGGTLTERNRSAFRLLIDQLKRGINIKAGSLNCVDLKSGETTTLGELVNKTKTKKFDFLNPIHRKKIDSYRIAGLTERQVAEELQTNEKMLYRNYPRHNSVSTSSTGRIL